MSPFHATTVLAVHRDGRTALAADGQVTVENHIVKTGARKLRRLAGGKVVAGFAGSAADALTLFEKFENQLEAQRGNLRRAALGLARDWRTDRMLRRLEAMLIVADRSEMLLLSGNGDVLEPDEGIAAIGSGGAFARAAATALMRHTALPAEEIAEQALRIAAALCIYTNDQIVVEIAE